jgi:antitoxin component of RelBE/YafQ-DinJ toxin-antitoxin module
MATQALTSRIDNEILATAETILQTHGLTAQDYCRMAIARLVNVGGIPWDTVDQQLAVASIKRQRRQRKINALQECDTTNEQTPTHD